MSNRSFRRLKVVFLCITLVFGAATVWLGYAWLGRFSGGGPPVPPWYTVVSALAALLGVSFYEVTGEIERGERGLRRPSGAKGFIRAFLRNL